MSKDNVFILTVHDAFTPLDLFQLYLEFLNSEPLSLTICNITNEKGKDVVFDGIVYTAHPVLMQSLKESLTDSTQATLDIANANDILRPLLNRKDEFTSGLLFYKKTFLEFADGINFNNPPVTANTRKTLKDAKYYVEQLKDITSEKISISVTSSKGLKLSIPNKRFGRKCSYNFKDENCKYTGNELYCDKTLERCKELNNTTSFSGVTVNQDNYY